MKLDDSERQRCEVWTRVMGYHRPTCYFNVGKKAEHTERVFFREDKANETFCRSEARATQQHVWDAQGAEVSDARPTARCSG